MPTQTTHQYLQSRLIPFKHPELWILEDFPVAANQVIPQGGTVALYTAASADEVQSLVGSSAVGTFQLVVGNAFTQVTTAITAASLTAATVQAALNAAFAKLCPGSGPTGFVTVTGSAWSSGGSGTFTLTYNNGVALSGPLAANPQTLIQVLSGGLTGGSVSCTETTKGVANNALVNYNNAINAAPAAAPTLGSPTGSDGTWGVTASVEIAYTLVTAAGESTLSPGAYAAPTTAQHIPVTSITGLDKSVTAINVYGNGMFLMQQAVTSQATGNFNILGPAATGAVPAPTVNTAYKNSDGSQIPVGFSIYAMAASPSGVITFGASAPTGNEFNPPNEYGGNVLEAGYVQTANLLTTGGAAGVDQNTVNTLGRLISGSRTSGVLAVR